MEFGRETAVSISTVIYVAAGILTVLPVPETVASPLIGHSDINKRSVSCLPGDFYNTDIGGCQACITCGKGEFFNDDCYGTSGPGTCSPCDTGYYQSKDSHADVSCSTCKHCQHRFRISRCTRTENAVCGDCVPGYYEKTVFSRNICMKCPTKGNIPMPCRQKPTTTTVPPVPSTTTTPPPSTTPTLGTSSPDITTSPVLVTTHSETHLPPTTPLSTTTVAFDGLTTTPTMTMDTEIPSPTIDPPPTEMVRSGPLASYGLSWVAIIAVSLLILVLLGALFCSRKRTSSSAGYISEGDTRGYLDHHSGGGRDDDDAGNHLEEDIELGENIKMLADQESTPSTGTSSISSTPDSSGTSTPRGSVYSYKDSLVSLIPNFDVWSVSWTKDLQKELLANIAVQLNEQVSKGLFEDFKTYCMLREKLEIRTLEDCTSFSDCVYRLIQQNDFSSEAVATFLCSFFENKNQQRCLNIIKEKFPHVSSGEKPFWKEEVSSSNLPVRLQGDDCDWTYCRKIEMLLERNGLNSLKFKDISTIVDGIDFMLQKNIKGVGSMFEIALAFKVKPDVAHLLKRYRSLENVLTMSKPDLTVKEFVIVLTMHNRIAAVKEIYEKLSCDHTMKELRRHAFNGQTLVETRSESWNIF